MWGQLYFLWLWYCVVHIENRQSHGSLSNESTCLRTHTRDAGCYIFFSLWNVYSIYSNIFFCLFCSFFDFNHNVHLCKHCVKYASFIKSHTSQRKIWLQRRHMPFALSERRMSDTGLDWILLHGNVIPYLKLLTLRRCKNINSMTPASTF